MVVVVGELRVSVEKNDFRGSQPSTEGKKKKEKVSDLALTFWWAGAQWKFNLEKESFFLQISIIFLFRRHPSCFLLDVAGSALLLYRCEEPAAGRQMCRRIGQHGVHPGSWPEGV